MYRYNASALIFTLRNTSIKNPRHSYILTIQSYIKVITLCVEASLSPNVKCYKILMAIFQANFRFGEADEVGKDVFSTETSI